MSTQPANLHRELAKADLTSDALRDFAVFALGWFGNHNPEEAVTCLQRYQNLQSKGKLS